MDTINIKYLLWSVNTGKIGQGYLNFEKNLWPDWLRKQHDK
jgi:hypothetical protein